MVHTLWFTFSPYFVLSVRPNKNDFSFRGCSKRNLREIKLGRPFDYQCEVKSVKCSLTLSFWTNGFTCLPKPAVTRASNR